MPSGRRTTLKSSLTLRRISSSTDHHSPRSLVTKLFIQHRSVTVETQERKPSAPLFKSGVSPYLVREALNNAKNRGGAFT
jgi:hypothetical protein